MRILRALAIIAAVTTVVSACSRSPEQLVADCAAGTAHRLEAGLDVADVALDAIDESMIETCGAAYEAAGHARSAFGAGRAAFAHDQNEIAIAWFEKSLAGLYRKDLNHHGIMTASYVLGDMDRAIESGRIAIDEGTRDAAGILGEIFADPNSGHYDFDAAVENYEIATRTESNGIYAMQRLYEIHLARGQSNQSPNKGKDLMAALRWSVARAKAEPSNVEAWLQPVHVVEVPGYPAPAADKRRIALDNYRKAADLGHAAAAFEVARALYFGEGLPEDEDASRPYFQIAANGGIAHAHYVLAHMYWSGIGADKNADLAEKHVLVAMEAGHADAKKLHADSIGPLMRALRAMPSKPSQSCMDGRPSSYNQTIYEVYNTCPETMNVVICENFAITDLIAFFQNKSGTTCRTKTVPGNGFVDSMYFSEADAALGWQLISGSKLQWGACYAPLRPSLTEGGKISCDW